MAATSHILNKKTKLYIVLCGFFLTNALIAEIIGMKIFSLEKTLGLHSAELNLFGYVLNFEHTAGVILWPFVFITTDIINEYYGRKGVQRISYLTVLFIGYAFFMIGFAMYATPAKFWTELYKNKLDIDLAFDTIFGQGMGIIIASLTAFLIGQLIDVYVFHSIRKKTGSKMLWLRATGSTIVSQLIDTFVVLYLAFYLFQTDPTLRWPVELIIAVGLMNYILKFAIAAALTPLLYVVHTVIDRYLGKELSDEMIEKAEE